MIALSPILSPLSSAGGMQAAPAVCLAAGPCGPALGGGDGAAVADRLSFRQLRHLTNNALQRILCQVAQHEELRRTREGRRLCEDIERRILFSAALADALFGMTREPGLLPLRLRGVGEASIGMLGDPDQLLSLDVSVEGRCPAALEEVVLRVAHELLGNVVKHGMRARLVGRIAVRVVSDESRVLLTVTDDGWGCGREPRRGEGLEIAQLLAGEHGGAVWLRRRGDMTVATLDLPHPASCPRQATGAGPCP